MDIQDLGAIGELVGAIAVVISLFYLAFQIRANTKSIQGSSYQDLLVLFQGVNNQAYDPEFSGVIRRFLVILLISQTATVIEGDSTFRISSEICNMHISSSQLAM